MSHVSSWRLRGLGYDRNGDSVLGHIPYHALRAFVYGIDAAVDIDEHSPEPFLHHHEAHGVVQEPFGDPAPRFEEVGGTEPFADNVTLSPCRARAGSDDANIAVEIDIGHSDFPAASFEGIVDALRAVGCDACLTADCGIVDFHLGVDSHESSAFDDGEGIDFRNEGVALPEYPEQPHQHIGAPDEFVACEPDAREQVACFVGHEIAACFSLIGRYPAGVMFRGFLDAHSALGARDDQRSSSKPSTVTPR
jgi:hypothetical protein